MSPMTASLLRTALILAVTTAAGLDPALGDPRPAGMPGEGMRFALARSQMAAQLVRTPLPRAPDLRPSDGGTLRTRSARPPAALNRRYRARHVPDYAHFVAFKVGRFDPDGIPDGGAFIGLRTGAEFENRLTLAFNIDATWRTFIDETEVAAEIDRTGNVVRTTATSLETSSTLIPLGVSLGLRLPGTRTVTPFIGAGVAYEVLVNHVEDHRTGIDDTSVYGGPGWQLFGGLMVPVASRARLLGELWWNDAEVSREIDAYVAGLPLTERIDVSGLGARFGIEVAFD